MSLIKVVGIDLAKLVFSIHGVDEHGKTKLRKTVKRNKLLNEVAKLPQCVIGMEACSGSHYWAREFSKLGHDVRIMASKFGVSAKTGALNASPSLIPQPSRMMRPTGVFDMKRPRPKKANEKIIRLYTR